LSIRPTRGRREIDLLICRRRPCFAAAGNRPVLRVAREGSNLGTPRSRSKPLAADRYGNRALEPWMRITGFIACTPASVFVAKAAPLPATLQKQQVSFNMLLSHGRRAPRHQNSNSSVLETRCSVSSPCRLPSSIPTFPPVVLANRHAPARLLARPSLIGLLFHVPDTQFA
jgi:hypothetical protein